MKLHLPCKLLAAVLACFCAVSSYTLGAESISINFANDEKGLEDSLTAGLYTEQEQAVKGEYWNRVDGKSGSQSNLTVYSGGTTTSTSGASVSWSSNNTYRGDWNFSTETTGDAQMLKGYLDDGGNGVTIDIIGLDFLSYDVYIYCNTDTASTKYSAKTVNGVSYTYVDGATNEGTTGWGNTGTKGAQSETDLETEVELGVNALHITGQNKADLTISSVRSDGRGCIAGIQIVNTYTGTQHTATLTGDTTWASSLSDWVDSTESAGAYASFVVDDATDGAVALTLDANKTTDAVFVSGGNMTIDGEYALNLIGPGRLSVASGATLTIASSTTLTGHVNLAGGGTVSVQNTSDVSDMDVGTGTTLRITGATSSANVDISSALSGGGRLSAAGNGGVVTLSDATGFYGTLVLAGSNVSLSSGTYSLGGLEVDSNGTLAFGDNSTVTITQAVTSGSYAYRTTSSKNITVDTGANSTITDTGYWKMTSGSLTVEGEGTYKIAGFSFSSDTWGDTTLNVAADTTLEVTGIIEDGSGTTGSLSLGNWSASSAVNLDGKLIAHTGFSVTDGSCNVNVKNGGELVMTDGLGLTRRWNGSGTVNVNVLNGGKLTLGNTAEESINDLTVNLNNGATVAGYADTSTIGYNFNFVVDGETKPTINLEAAVGKTLVLSTSAEGAATINAVGGGVVELSNALSGSTSYVAHTVDSVGTTLRLSGGEVEGFAGSYAAESDSTLEFAGADNTTTTYAAAITGAGKLSMSGSATAERGIVELSNATGFAGTVVLNGGHGVLSSGTYSLAGLEVSNHGTLEFGEGCVVAINQPVTDGVYAYRYSNEKDIIINTGADSVITDAGYWKLKGGSLTIEGGGVYKVAGFSLSADGAWNGSSYYGPKSTLTIAAETELEVTGEIENSSGCKGSLDLAHWRSGDDHNTLNVEGRLTANTGFSVKDGSADVYVKQDGELVMKKGLALTSRGGAVVVSVESGGTLMLGDTASQSISHLTVNLANGSTLSAYEDDTQIAYNFTYVAEGETKPTINLEAADGKKLVLSSSTTDAAGINAIGGGEVELASALSGSTIYTAKEGTTLRLTKGEGDGFAGSYAVESNSGLELSAAANATYAGAISGAGSVTKTGSAEVTLSGSNSYAGGTTVKGGTLTTTKGAALGSGAVTVKADGTLSLTKGEGVDNDAADIANTINLQGGSIEMAAASITGNVVLGNKEDGTTSTSAITANDAALKQSSTITGTGNLTLNGTSGALNVYSDASFKGNLAMDSGTINLGHSYVGGANIHNDGDVNITGAAVSLNRKDSGTSTLANTGAVNITSGSLTVNSGTTVDNGGAINVRGGSLVLKEGSIIGSSIVAQTGNATDGYTSVATFSAIAVAAEASVFALPVDPTYANVTVTNSGIVGGTGGGSVADAKVTVTGAYSISDVTFSNSQLVQGAGADLTCSNVMLEGTTTVTLSSLESSTTDFLSGMTLRGELNLDLSSDLIAEIVASMNASQSSYAITFTGIDTSAETVSYSVSDNVRQYFEPVTWETAAEGANLVATFSLKAPAAIPEPATATLSLLALAALTVRRRRK